MPIPVQTTRQITPLRKAFGLFGGLRLKLDETVVPVAVVEDLVQSDWRDAFVADTRGAPGVGNRNLYSLENPDASGTLIALDSVAVSGGGSCTWRARVTSTPFVPGTILSPQWQDLDGVYVVPNRFPVANPRWAAAAAAAGGADVAVLRQAPNTTYTWLPRVTIHPGQEINIYQDTTNLDANISFQWRERPLLPTER